MAMRGALTLVRPCRPIIPKTPPPAARASQSALQARIEHVAQPGPPGHRGALTNRRGARRIRADAQEAVMAYVKDSKSARVRRQLDHPVIDGDGHWLEPLPIFLDYLKQVGGPSLVEHFRSKDIDRGWYAMTREERLDKRPHRPTWWGEPANTLDRATAMVPRLFYERLDDFGVDFCLLYTSLGLFHINNADEQIRRGVSRAVNLMNAEMFAPYRDRIAPAAVVPVYTPEEAIEEATYAVTAPGFKVIMISNHVKRPIPALARAVADPSTVRYSIDSLGYESLHDYDRFWRACV